MHLVNCIVIHLNSHQSDPVGDSARSETLLQIVKVVVSNHPRDRLATPNRLLAYLIAGNWGLLRPI